MTRPNAVLGVLAASAIVASLLAGAASAVRDEIGRLRGDAGDARAVGWKGSEEDRLRRALAGWHPIVEGVRKAVPEHAAVFGWVGSAPPDANLTELFSLFAVTLAPRLCVPVESAGRIEVLRPDLEAAGLATFALEVHPSFGPRPVQRGQIVLAPSAHVVDEGPDFTLWRFEPGR